MGWLSLRQALPRPKRAHLDRAAGICIQCRQRTIDRDSTSRCRTCLDHQRDATKERNRRRRAAAVTGHG